MEKKTNIDFTSEIDTDLANEETTLVSDDQDEDIFSNFEELSEAEMDLTTTKIKELNKKLPSWSLEPPHNFVK